MRLLIFDKMHMLLLTNAQLYHSIIPVILKDYILVKRLHKVFGIPIFFLFPFILSPRCPHLPIYVQALIMQKDTDSNIVHNTFHSKTYMRFTFSLKKKKCEIHIWVFVLMNEK